MSGSGLPPAVRLPLIHGEPLNGSPRRALVLARR
jgi:hypothetical protein